MIRLFANTIHKNRIYALPNLQIVDLHMVDTDGQIRVDSDRILRKM